VQLLLQGITRSARALRDAVADGGLNIEAREDMAVASVMGGLCLANAKLGTYMYPSYFKVLAVHLRLGCWTMVFLNRSPAAWFGLDWSVLLLSVQFCGQFS
jgi:hypothetical protein